MVQDILSTTRIYLTADLPCKDSNFNIKLHPNTYYTYVDIDSLPNNYIYAPRNGQSVEQNKLTRFIKFSKLYLTKVEAL